MTSRLRSGKSLRFLEREFVEIQTPQTKLEVVSNDTLRLIVVLFATAVAGFVAGAAWVQSAISPGEQNVSLLYAVGALLTIALACLVFIAVAFTQRIVVRTCFGKQHRALPQQVLIIAFAWTMLVFPEFSIVGVVEFWTKLSTTDAMTIEEQDLIESLADLNTEATNTLSLFTVMLFTVFYAVFISVHGKYTVGLGRKLALNDQRLQEEKRQSLHDPPSHDADNEAALEGDMEVPGKLKARAWLAALPHGVKRAGQEAKSRVMEVTNSIPFCSAYYICCCCICCSKARCVDATSNRGVLRRSLPSGLIAALSLYLFVFIVLSDFLKYEPSIVPFVGLITVFRVCSTADDAGMSYCNASGYPKGFQRAFASTAFSILDVFIVYLVSRQSRAVRETLSHVPYALNRPNNLGFAFAIILFNSSFLAVELFGLLEVSIPPAQNWIPQDPQTMARDPLAIVGVTSATFAFVATSVLLSLTTVILAYGYLPADSSGCSGWCVPNSMVKACCRPRSLDKRGQQPSQGIGGEEAGAATRARVPDDNSNYDDDNNKGNDNGGLDASALQAFFQDNPLFLPFESDFEEILVRKRESNLDLPATSDAVVTDRVLRAIGGGGGGRVQLELLRTTAAGLAAEDFRVDEQLCGTLMAQLRSNVLVLSTEVQLFNCASVVYPLSATRGEPKTGFEFEEKSAMIEDGSLELLEHVVDEVSHTHAIVLLGSDRVVVSFRGTVSGVNVKTDLDWNLTPHAGAAEVKAPAQATPMAQMYADKPPKVHKGFQEAYGTVAERIFELVRPHVLDRGLGHAPPRQRRALLLTGHSLGGGLAILCALDFAQRVKAATEGEGDDDAKPAVSCTTFGCPRMCNYSFAVRFAAAVPCARRFVLANDIIPKTPFRVATWSRFSGYQHVGIELLLDMRGNLLIAPTSLELVLLHGFKRLNQSRHFTSRYLLALLLFFGQLELAESPGFWSGLVSSMCRFAHKEIEAVDEDLLRKAYGVFFQEGVAFTFHGKDYSTAGTQTAPPELPGLAEQPRPVLEQGKDCDLEQNGRGHVLREASLDTVHEDSDSLQSDDDVEEAHEDLEIEPFLAAGSSGSNSPRALRARVRNRQRELEEILSAEEVATILAALDNSAGADHE